MNILLKNITKRFNRVAVFKAVNVSISKKGIYIVTGRNGSGKSTFLKCLLKMMPVTKGTIELNIKRAGFVAPYYQLFNELTAKQNIELILHEREVTEKKMLLIMDKFQLSGKEFVHLRDFSSGMLQRFRYLVACINDPDLLVIDEPTVNLDSDGKKFVQELITEYGKKAIVILATNEPEEIKWGDPILALS